MRVASCIALLALAASAVAAQSTFPSKAYGYVNINSTYDSSMFYAIRGDDTVPASVRAERPLVMWLQGGPGASSMFGDFLETGPVKLEATGATTWELVNRTHTWVRHANMLYVDNPVGTGFSYTTDPRGFSTTDEEIAANLVTFLKGFLQVHTEYQGKPFWVFCESYGGKMVAYYGAALMRAVNAGDVPISFKGVALGDGWVDPVSCMYSYGPYLKAFSQVTDDQAANITRYAQYAQDALERGNGTMSTNWWSAQQGAISDFAHNVNWYNSLYYYDYTATNQFELFARTTWTQELGSIIPSGVSFGSQAGEVFQRMSGSFMRDGIRQVQDMIDGGLSVNVYGGQVDLIVDTLCIQAWMDKLPWSELASWKSATRAAFTEPTEKNVAGFVQKYKNFAFWQINQAGHMVPLDQPWAAEHMMATIIGGDTSSVPPPEQNAKKGKINVRPAPRFAKP
jgi:serine carboxypeptidase 1